MTEVFIGRRTDGVSLMKMDLLTNQREQAVDRIPTNPPPPTQKIYPLDRHRKFKHWRGFLPHLPTWEESVSRRRGTNMEQFASRSDVIKCPAKLQNQTKIVFIPGVVFIVSELLTLNLMVCNVISRTSGDDREGAFLFQRVSVLVQRYNTVLFHDSLPAPDCTD